MSNHIALFDIEDNEVSERCLEFFAPCDPPTSTHQAKKIVKAGRFSKLADKPELRNAREFWTGLLAQYRPNKPFDGPVSLTLRFCYPFPASATKKSRMYGHAWKVTRPDCSNAAKTVEDILVALLFMSDDNQVARLVVEKKLSEAPGLYVCIEKLKD